MFPAMAGLILLAFAADVALCQSVPSFEAASIRLNKDSQGRGNMEFLPGGERFSATHVPLGALIQTAYNLTSPQCSCYSSAVPVLLENYDIQAKAERPVSPAEMLRLLQDLLQNRFKLVLRHETKELQAYAMVVDKGGPKLRASSTAHVNDAAPLNPYHARGVEGHSYYALDIMIKDATMADLAWRLSSLTILEDHVVIDKTGLAGHYDLDLKFSGVSPTEPLSGNDAPSIFTALREQLGLRLDAQKISLEVLSVEHAERPSEN
jgi:uncharacterized protein (TIGR03435 family)